MYMYTYLWWIDIMYSWPPYFTSDWLTLLVKFLCLTQTVNAHRHWLTLLVKFLCLTQTVNAHRHVWSCLFWGVYKQFKHTSFFGLSPHLLLLLSWSLILQCHPWPEYLWDHYVQSTGWLTAANRLPCCGSPTQPVCSTQQAAAAASRGDNYSSQSTASAPPSVVTIPKLWLWYEDAQSET